MRKTIFSALFLVGFGGVAFGQSPSRHPQHYQSQDYHQSYRAPSYPGYYNGWGRVNGYERLPNGWNRLTLPGGQTLMHYHDGYVPNRWDNNYYPNANYGAVRRP